MRVGATSDENAALIQGLRDNPILGEITAMRTAFDAEGAAQALPEGIAEREALLGGRASVWFEGGVSDRVVLYLHGGGFAIGSPTSHRHLVGLLAKLAGCAVVIPDYRLAPEHTFPAALDDAVAAYRELLETYPAPHIALAGDSAGGGLVVALIAALNQERLPQPACAYCISPWVDLECSSASLAAKAAQDPIGSAEALTMLGQMYLGGADARHPLASPVRADLRGAPPMLVQVGSAEVLLDDSIEPARVLGHADCSVRLEIWRDMIHVWPLHFPQLPEGREALEAGAAFIARALECAHSTQIGSAA